MHHSPIFRYLFVFLIEQINPNLTLNLKDSKHGVFFVVGCVGGFLWLRVWPEGKHAERVIKECCLANHYRTEEKLIFSLK